MISNYHTHLHFCGHAEGNSIDYAKEAVKQGFKVLGISDHAPNPLMTDHFVRMKPQYFVDYLKDIEVAQEKFKNKLTIYKGIEVEFFYKMDSYYQELKESLDYMILGQHYISLDKTMKHLQSGFALKTKEEIYTYAEYLIDGMSTGYFDVIAHPDLYMCGYKDFDEHATKVAHMICKKAEETNTILEFNANGFRRGVSQTPQGIKRPYPRLEFWDIVKTYDITTMINSDCHSPEILYDSVVKEAEEVYRNLGLKTIDILNIK